METTRWQRWAPAAGLAAIAVAAAAVALERPWPDTREPAELPEFLADNRAAIVAQSLLFLVSAGLFMWFLASLRSHLAGAEGGTARLSTLAFAAGMVGYGLEVIGQAPQVTLTLPAQSGRSPESAAVLTDLGYAMIAVANLPLAVMFAAVAVVSLRTGAFPTWLGWLAGLAAAAALALPFAVVDPTGPLAPQGWASYVLYLVPVVWVIPAAIVMIRRPG
jgi:hypothetical protein